MTKNRARKQAVRATMSLTGENYTRARRQSGTRPAPEKFRLGTSNDGEDYFLHLTRELTDNIHLVGGTGSGWSHVLRVLVDGMLTLGWSGTVLDMHDDRDLATWCAEAATRHRTPFQSLTRGHAGDGRTFSGTWLDPLTDLDSSVVTDLIAGMSEFDDAYWRSRTELVTSLAVHDLEVYGAPAAGRDLSAVIDKLHVIGATGDCLTGNLPQADLRKAAAGLSAKLQLLRATTHGQRVLTPTDAPALDPRAAGVTYVGADHLARPDLSRLVSGSVLAQLRAGMSRGRSLTHERRFLVVVEPTWTDKQALRRLLSRSRSDGTLVLLCTTESLGQRGRIPRAWEQILEMMWTTIAMRHGSRNHARETAEELCWTGYGVDATARDLMDLSPGDALVRTGSTPLQRVKIAYRPDLEDQEDAR